MVQWGVQEFEVKGHLRGQFWLYYSNGPATPSPTVYRIDWMIMKVGHYNHSPMVQWGVQEFEVKGHLRGQFWLYYSNGPAAPSPTVYRIDWMIMKVGHYHHSPMEQWGVQEFEAKGHLEVNFAHFVRTVKLLCLNSQITRGYKFETCQSHCKYC